MPTPAPWGSRHRLAGSQDATDASQKLGISMDGSVIGWHDPRRVIGDGTCRSHSESLPAMVSQGIEVK
jgi:hypothetical protein